MAERQAKAECAGVDIICEGRSGASQEACEKFAGQAIPLSTWHNQNWFVLHRSVHGIVRGLPHLVRFGIAFRDP